MNIPFSAILTLVYNDRSRTLERSSQSKFIILKRCFMRYRSILSLILMLTISSSALCANANLSLVPMPSEIKVEANAPAFEVTSVTRVLYSPEFKDSARLVHDMFARAAKFDLPTEELTAANEKEGSAVLFKKVAEKDLKTTESYRMTVTAKMLRIEATGPAGAFYGVQTLRQLLNDYIETENAPAATQWTVPAMTIKDEPEFEWRGLMLDCSRHYQSIENIKKTLDALALLKQNRFHWHLTDNNGWRIQIDKYPKLTEVASTRGPEGAKHEGYYTKEQIKEIVAYAKARYIEIVPEFEMPAHSNAANLAYPELSCKGTPYKLPETTAPASEFDSLSWYHLEEGARHFCAGNDKVFEFFDDIFDECLELFPFSIWHVGGDERPDGIWSKCPKCQARMKANNLKDEHALQTWFMQRISNALAKRGKTVISWGVCRDQRYFNPLDLDDLGNNAIIMNWHGYTKLACQLGMRVVNCSVTNMYLDYPEFKMYPGYGRPSWMSYISLPRVYAFDPVPEGLTDKQKQLILGTQVCVWTEFLPTSELFPWIFPRVLAASEVSWLPAKQRQNYPEFKTRVDALAPRFAMMGIPFGMPVVNGNREMSGN